MRMFLNLLLAVMLAVTLAACGSDSSPAVANNGGSDQGGNDGDDGGDGDNGDDDEPSPEFTAASAASGNKPKMLRLEWTFDGEADHFTIEVNASGAGYVPADVNFDSVVDANDRITGSADSVDIPLALHFADLHNTLYHVVARDADGEEIARSGNIATLDIALNSMIGYVKSSNEVTSMFGQSVALSADGRTLAVGASNGSAPAAGAVHVFHRDDAGAWAQQAYVEASNAEAFDAFGVTVALSADGNTLAVGATGEDSVATGIDGDQADNAAEESGAVYVFTRDGTGAWTQQAYVKASNTEEDDAFGDALSLSADGNTLAVGAYGEDSAATGIDGNEADNGSSLAGAVYVFTRDDVGAWTQQAYVKASNAETFDEFGRSTSLSADGKTLVVGARTESSVATGIDGDETDDSAPAAGAVYVFTHDDVSGWEQQAYVKASNTQGGDQFGGTVSLAADGKTLAVGARGEDSAATGIDGDQADNAAEDSGAVYVFTRDGTGAWAQQAYVKASNAGEEDYFGIAVAIAGDGRTLAVGAERESSAATGINGDADDDSQSNAGAVYLY